MSSAPTRQLNAGPLQAHFETASGCLRYVRCGDEEVVRGVYVAVRDRNWGTIEPRIANLVVDQQNTEYGGSFTATFDAECRAEEIDFRWSGRIVGSAGGEIEYRMQGRAERTFLKNRIGFCVLHPVRECAGQTCRVLLVDGRETEFVFPVSISPHQPMRGFAALRHALPSGVEVEIALAGDVFEMEDQRNWTDASYKTYCTPLELPFPVVVEAGSTIEQRVRITVRDLRRHATPTRIAADVHSRGERLPSLRFDGRRLPSLGLCTPDDVPGHSADEVGRLRQLRPGHLRHAVAMTNADWTERLRTAHELSESLQTPLDLAIVLTNDFEAELADLAATCQARPSSIANWLILRSGSKASPATCLEAARRHLRPLAPGARILGGTDAYFAELNRERPDLRLVDGVCYSINPQVHACDDASLMETLEAQGATVGSAAAFSGGLPIVVGPITLRPRFNPNATATDGQTQPGELPDSVDPRQRMPFAAAWTVASVGELAAAGADRLTYFETIGWRGLMERATGSPLPQKFPSQPGVVFPAYHVLADIGEFAGAEFAATSIGSPMQLYALALRRGMRQRLIVANLRPRDALVHLTDAIPAEVGMVRSRFLDEGTAESAARQPAEFRNRWSRFAVDRPTTIGPYGVATFDLIGEDA